MARTRSEIARQKILDSAAELALDAGVRALTIGEVAARSGVAKTTIYRHFPTKNDLIVSAIDAITPLPSLPDTGSVHTDLVHFLGEIRPVFASDELRAVFLEVMAIAIFDPELASLQRSMMEVRGEVLTTIVQRAQERGEIPREVSIELAFELIEGPLIIRGLLHPEVLDDLDLDDLVTTIIARLHI